MASDKKLELEGFSVDENNKCVAEGGFEGVFVGTLSNYTESSTTSLSEQYISVDDTSGFVSVNPNPDAKSGQELIVIGEDISNASSITTTRVANASSIVLADGCCVSLVKVDLFWYVRSNFGATIS
jgi:hypothetical protein